MLILQFSLLKIMKTLHFIKLHILHFLSQIFNSLLILFKPAPVFPWLEDRWELIKKIKIDLENSLLLLSSKIVVCLLLLMAMVKMEMKSVSSLRISFQLILRLKLFIERKDLSKKDRNIINKANLLVMIQILWVKLQLKAV